MTFQHRQCCRLLLVVAREGLGFSSEGVEVFEEEQPEGLLGVVELSGATGCRLREMVPAGSGKWRGGIAYAAGGRFFSTTSRISAAPMNL